MTRATERNMPPRNRKNIQLVFPLCIMNVGNKVLNNMLSANVAFKFDLLLLNILIVVAIRIKCSVWYYVLKQKPITSL